MFNWFNKKVSLKKDTDIMSSVYNRKGLKLGSEIIVPTNFQCLIFHKGKQYSSLNEGKYKVDKKSLLELIEHQQRKNPKLKYIKCVCHYINTSSQKLELSYKKHSFIANFTISDVEKFTSLALLYSFKVDNESVIDLLNGVFRELLIYCKGDCNKISTNSLEDFGLTINYFSKSDKKSSIFNTSKKKDSSEKPNSTEQSLTENINSIEENQNNKITTTNEQPKQLNEPQITFPTCPKCNTTAKFNTTYCLKCGYKLQ